MLFFLFWTRREGPCSSINAAFATIAAWLSCAQFWRLYLPSIILSTATLRNCRPVWRAIQGTRYVSPSWPSLQAANAMAMVCHRHLRLQDERLLLTRAWYLISSQHSGLTHKSTNHATFTCCSSLTGTAQDFGFRVSVGLGGAVLGFFRCL